MASQSRIFNKASQNPALHAGGVMSVFLQGSRSYRLASGTDKPKSALRITFNSNILSVRFVEERDKI